MPALPEQSVPRVAVIGAGPAGLMAADVLAGSGLAVTVFDAMPSVGRKFLRAGIGGLNLTHGEAFDRFVTRYGEAREALLPALQAFTPEDLRVWAQGLGIVTFTGSSGRVFPVGMKASPLLRAWLQRLQRQGVQFQLRHRWLGWQADGSLRFSTPDGEVPVQADAVVLALGGGSWARLGSDAAWLPCLQQRGVAVSPLQPANGGFEVGWSEVFKQRFAGQPLKTVVLSFHDVEGRLQQQRGECLVTQHGLEGSVIYALSAGLRRVLQGDGSVTVHLDLMPDRSEADLAARLARPRGKASQSSHWRKSVGLEGVKAGLLRECAPDSLADPLALAAAIKALPVRLVGLRPMDEAISTAGGVAWQALDEKLMLRGLPGVFCAGEMLDWEAPTGGYLLTACFATGRQAARGVLACLPQDRCMS